MCVCVCVCVFPILFCANFVLYLGMLKRTKYSRLRNDSLTSLEDHPQRMLPLKGDFCLDSDFAQLDPGTPAHQGASTLRDFIPRVANIRLQSPISLNGFKPRHFLDTLQESAANLQVNPTFRCEDSLPPSDLSTPSLRTFTPPSLSDRASCVGSSDSSCSSSTSALLVCECICYQRSPRYFDCGCSLVYHFTLKSESNWCFVVFFQYVGSVEVTQSMRTLDFDTRMQVTR
uniref:Uncharacterized protein n=1 Tax=Acanthochromis polyacanthus TaxID=80966 RepID=A0A3Q1F4R7_9TELE